MVSFDNLIGKYFGKRAYTKIALLTLLSTIILLVITLIYACETAEMREIMALELDLKNQPYMSVNFEGIDFDWGESGSLLIAPGFNLKNVGQVPLEFELASEKFIFNGEVIEQNFSNLQGVIFPDTSSYYSFTDAILTDLDCSNRHFYSIKFQYGPLGGEKDSFILTEGYFWFELDAEGNPDWDFRTTLEEAGSSP